MSASTHQNLLGPARCLQVDFYTVTTNDTLRWKSLVQCLRPTDDKTSSVGLQGRYQLFRACPEQYSKK